VTYPESIQFLHSLQMFGMHPGLETTRRLAARAGDPQANLRFIHVAGTNGKGSTCAMLESIYRAAGFKVGLYTSPHLVSFRERIQVNRRLITEDEVVRLVTDLRGSIEPDSPITFFEFVTVLALKYFAEQNCELVIWETGLGGRLDATNIVTPLASVITVIGLDHQKWLGDTLTQIAAEKAGIIKPGVPVISGANEPEAANVIEATALRAGSALVRVEPPLEWPGAAAETTLPLPGEHQKQNAAVALTTVSVLQRLLPVPDEALSAGLQGVAWPGRFQVARHGLQTIILDGAHNPDGAAVLVATLQQQFPDIRPAMILGMMADKDCAEICNRLAPLADHIYLVPVTSERRALPSELAWHCRQANPQATTQLANGLKEALELARNHPHVLIAGSLYLVGEALELLSLAEACDERRLNDWKPR
jgi:dihydrofolate synthase/folylpolyglutamate synthase